MLQQKGLVATRSQAESFIKLGEVSVDGKVVTKPGVFVGPGSDIRTTTSEQYVSRAGLKLASVAKELGLNFKNQLMLDVGSSTGGFTDFALRRGAKKVIAIDVGTNQLHPTLRSSKRVELHEKTDIRNFLIPKTDQLPTIIVIDISFMSLRLVLPHIAKNLTGPNTQIVAMVKPQFEAGKDQVSKGVIKNDTVRRQIFKNFEVWVKQYFVIVDKSDSQVHGAAGNQERFYLLQRIKS